MGESLPMDRQPGRLDAERGRPASAGRVGRRLCRADAVAVETQARSDARPRDAIDGLRAFARGEMRIGRVRALSAQAHTAARAIGDPAAVAAARALDLSTARLVSSALTPLRG